MVTVEYIVKNINGDYGVLVDGNGVENMVAMFLLPDEIAIGSKILYEDFEYTIIL